MITKRKKASTDAGNATSKRGRPLRVYSINDAVDMVRTGDERRPQSRHGEMQNLRFFSLVNTNFFSHPTQFFVLLNLSILEGDREQVATRSSTLGLLIA